MTKEVDSIIANQKLEEEFEMNYTHMYLIDDTLDNKKENQMVEEIKEVDGINNIIGLDALIGPAFPKEMLPQSIIHMLQNDQYQLMLINSKYKVASQEVNTQVDALNAIIKSYDDTGMLVGEAPCTKDLIRITNTDFKVVSIISIGVIFIIIGCVFKSISLPIILVSVIEFAIFINMGIPCFTNTALPFIASIVIGTIQLGATVDYAILMTTRYKKERYKGIDKEQAVAIAHKSSMKSVLISALSFFAATFGVGMYSNIDMISSLCSLMARGALISMLVVIFILPSMFLLFDKIIITTSLGFKEKGNKSITRWEKKIC